MLLTKRSIFLTAIVLGGIAVIVLGLTRPIQDDLHQSRREAMVREQIAERGVRDEAVLEAMRKVPRHLFVQEKHLEWAYNDHPLPIGYGQTISQPYIVGFMTEQLQLAPDDKVLEIGTGSGYQAAILGEICNEVFTIEIVEALGKQSQQLLEDLGSNHVKVRIGDGYRGWPDEAPFDAIIVTCAPTDIPEPLQDQLAEGGRMIIPVGNFGNQRLVLLKKVDGRVKKQSVLNVAFVPMVDDTGKKY